MAGSLPPVTSIPSLKRKRSHENNDRSLESAVSPPSNASLEVPTDQIQSTTGKALPNETNAQETEPKKPVANQKKAKGKKASSKSSKRIPSAPLPDAFKRLSQIHRALNLVYTFCCTRKHFATTFENIKKAVQAQIGQGRELTLEDVARVKVIIPGAIRFEYIDEAKLEIMITGDQEIAQYGLHKRASLAHAADMDADENTGGNIHDTDDTKHVLLFEFVDGDLKREVVHPKTGEPTKPMRRMKDEDLKMPVYSQKQMLRVIEKRNSKFTDALNEFLVQCEDSATDPVESLEQAKNAFLPTPPGSGANTPALAGRVPATIPKERKSIEEIIAEIREMDWYHAQIVPEGHRVFEAQSPVYGDLSFQLSQDLVNALYNTKGITEMYTHQTEAINHLYEGHNVIVSTSTSSGKSLIYQVPMLHELEKDPESRGMYIFPTKALAQDQRRSMMDLLQYMNGLQNTMVETFDGDTPMGSRNMIRDEARIIFTNPDMLHITILPQESSWRTFLKNLKFVVVDELHVYNGLFGSHVAFIMRRLRRICAAVGNRHVKFISCSATVANPEAHMKSIFGVQDVKLVDVDGSPSGRKEFVCWNTPFKDPKDPTSGRADTVTETARLFCQLILRGVRVIAFCRIRKLCEILLQGVRAEFDRLERTEIGKLVMGYRGGYSPQDRRQIEKEMFEGKLMGIVATNALELGVDIGSLDAVITMGFPYSISNLRQQSGRAGRRNKDSLSPC
ncbi:Helicase C-terminal [Penicillium paradoxum]|uniref:Helicase C-terminal n=1 Tax=Penicillium paradoxum TaxID=176176 RepID=UPI0025468D8D|nr:Helicase C-terminal [Penicillium paradoxum]KAJ5787521.1 Helicase C-terminal [Penicillium paradoxum]